MNREQLDYEAQLAATKAAEHRKHAAGSKVSLSVKNRHEKVAGLYDELAIEFRVLGNIVDEFTTNKEKRRRELNR